MAAKPETTSEKAETSLGLSENIEGLLCYSFTLISGAIFLVVEKKSKFVRFHAIQSIVAFFLLSIPVGLWEQLLDNDFEYYVVDFIIFVLLNQHPLIPMYILLDDPYAFEVFYMSFLSFFLWIFLMYGAYRGKKYKLPIVGSLAEKYS
ncbi:TPA: hypothetical protein HA351_13440 [Methanosarcinaceae archaeon]|nr:hypothetical protein [Methanosarcinaceae archaeon]